MDSLPETEIDIPHSLNGSKDLRSVARDSEGPGNVRRIQLLGFGHR